MRENVACVRRDRGGVGGGGWVKRKLKREADKGDNERKNKSAKTIF